MHWTGPSIELRKKAASFELIEGSYGFACGLLFVFDEREGARRVPIDSDRCTCHAFDQTR